ncbi:MAG: malate/lactate/ureidoglycolate dehydrogenase [Methylocystis sp.]|nr:malate/lactate/ureidoglycolate dehydrogenase [Methylocystis sp.]MCA3584260.1 malate/lactate/ureidoglycolate dehydrogenase [Methylocystis sp.]MCA3589140.1 malate/lactate/ureidoglycolate dehydrogenase [Methylocystis sp.]MCA3591415.1 malate/lactate/ureidoglycolate dehydrogenase [Methylocystis sp.]
MRHFSADHLTRLTTAIFEAAGWPEADAAEVARHCTLANLSGHDSHGIGMVPLYIRSFRDGWLKPANTPVDRINAPPFLVIDAQVALGQPTATNAVQRAASMAKTQGVAILNLIDAHHIGRIGDYAEQAAAHGLISFFWVNVAGRPPIVAAHGAKEGRWGTNPHAIGIPSPDGAHMVLDFATSRMAHGKVRVALNKGERVAEGYLIDSEGRPTTDPAVAFAPGPLGALLPFGEHKGAGLAFMVELLSAGLAGGALIKDKPARTWIINSLFGILIDPLRLDPDEAARADRIASVTAFLRAARPQDSADPVRAPGDKEREMRALRLRDGIPLDDETWRQIAEAAAWFGIDAEAG